MGNGFLIRQQNLSFLWAAFVSSSSSTDVVGGRRRGLGECGSLARLNLFAERWGYNRNTILEEFLHLKVFL